MDQDDVIQTGWELRLLNGAGLLVAVGESAESMSTAAGGWVGGMPGGNIAEMRALIRIAAAVAAHPIAAAALPAVVLTPTGAARIGVDSGVSAAGDADAVSALAAAGSRAFPGGMRARAVSVYVQPAAGSVPVDAAPLTVSVSAVGRSGTALTRRLFRATAQALLAGDDHAACGAPVDADSLLRPAFDFGSRSSDESSDD